MTQIVKRSQVEVEKSTDEIRAAIQISLSFRSSSQFRKKVKTLVLDYIFRTISFISREEKIRVLTKADYIRINHDTGIPIIIIHKIVSKFLVDLVRFKKFLNSNLLSYSIEEQNKKVLIYLHKIFRLAPVFDYKRAKKNVEILRSKLDSLFFWPCLTSQIAIVIFVTNLLDKNNKDKPRLIQGNLRSLCDCSAYAFHRTRNKIGLTTPVVRNLQMLL
jgi:hypothetical protein